MSVLSAYHGSFHHPPPPSTQTQRITYVLTSVNPEQIAASDKRVFSVANAIGEKANNTNNTGTVYLGFDTNNQPYPIDPGDWQAVKADPEKRKGVSGLWLRGAIGDGIVLEFEQ